MAFISFDWWTWVVIPFLIFLARIVDVSIGTLRVIFISKGFKRIAPVLGFFEVIVWLLAISQVMKNLTNWASYVSYGLGFATGTYVGMLLEEKISIGKVILQIMVKSDVEPLTHALSAHYHLTAIDGKSSRDSDVKIIFMVIKRTEIKNVLDIVNLFQPKAFYTIEDVRYSLDSGIVPTSDKKYWLFNILNKKK